MSGERASELLKALTPHEADLLEDALPEIIAVVHAAEFYLGEYTQGRPALTIGIEQALNRLASKLSGEGQG